MMKRTIFSILLAFVAMAVAAQEEQPQKAQAEHTQKSQNEQPQKTETAPLLRFGYLNCDSAVRALPEYAIVENNLADLRSKYDAEMKRVEDEFNQKYELFLEEQRNLAPSILQKRQAELQELIEKNAAFKEKARSLLADAEKEAFAPLRLRVNNAIRQIGQARGLAFVVNGDANTLPYVDPVMGEDITEAVIRIAKQTTRNGLQ